MIIIRIEYQNEHTAEIGTALEAIGRELQERRAGTRELRDEDGEIWAMMHASIDRPALRVGVVPWWGDQTGVPFIQINVPAELG